MDLISLIAPTSEDRIAMIAREAEGFLYIVSSLGVTGVRSEIKGDLFAIEGTVPNFSDMPAGCRFCDRCPYADEQCRTREPQLRDIGGGHLVRCFREVET